MLLYCTAAKSQAQLDTINTSLPRRARRALLGTAPSHKATWTRRATRAFAAPSHKATYPTSDSSGPDEQPDLLRRQVTRPLTRRATPPDPTSNPIFCGAKSQGHLTRRATPRDPTSNPSCTAPSHKATCPTSAARDPTSSSSGPDEQPESSLRRQVTTALGRLEVQVRWVKPRVGFPFGLRLRNQLSYAFIV